MKSNKIKKILDIQVIIMILSLIFIITSFFVTELADFREIVLGIILLTMAFTNKYVCKRGGITILYLVFGLLLIIPNIVRLIK